MKNIISIAQLVVACIIIILVVIQGNGSGMGEAFGDSSGFSHQRRGAERGIFIITLVALALFIATSLANLLVR